MSQRAETRGCSEVQDRLDALLDGELEAQEAALLRRHLGACPLCRAELGRAEELRAQLRDMPTFEVPGRVATAVAAATGVTGGARRGTRAPGSHRWMPLITALAAAVLVAVVTGPWRSRVTPVAPEAAAARQAAAEARLALHLLADVTRQAERRARARVLDDAVVPTAQRVSASLWWLRDGGAAVPAPGERPETSTAEGSL